MKFNSIADDGKSLNLSTIIMQSHVKPFLQYICWAQNATSHVLTSYCFHSFPLSDACYGIQSYRVRVICWLTFAAGFQECEEHGRRFCRLGWERTSGEASPRRAVLDLSISHTQDVVWQTHGTLLWCWWLQRVLVNAWRWLGCHFFCVRVAKIMDVVVVLLANPWHAKSININHSLSFRIVMMFMMDYGWEYAVKHMQENR